MDTLSAMYSSHNTNNVKLSLFYKAAILIIAALFTSNEIYAQEEYSNWMLRNGIVLNFNTLNTTIQCDNNDEIGTFSFALSDDNGRILIYGYKIYDSSQSTNDYVIKNNKNEIIIKEQCGDLKNIVYCKHPSGGYYLAIVYLDKRLESTFCIYQFDNRGSLTNTYRYDNGIYRSFLVMLPLGDDIKLLVYNIKDTSLESYKLQKDGVAFEKKYDVELGAFKIKPYVPFCIRQSIVGSKIYASTGSDFFIIDISHETGNVSVSKTVKANDFSYMALSANDRYLMAIYDFKLIAYDLMKDFDLSDYQVFYDFSSDIDQNIYGDWDIQTGIDGKTYVARPDNKKLYIVDGIETGDVVVETIESDCLETSFWHNPFPQILRCPKSSPAVPCSTPPAAPRIIPE